ncbi:MAG: hypothetical protein LR011_06940 [Verrucomicrobia bacterium]|nr:hypothetical protein [Verrucomicrobiota bacterium]
MTNRAFPENSLFHLIWLVGVMLMMGCGPQNQATSNHGHDHDADHDHGHDHSVAGGDGSHTHGHPAGASATGDDLVGPNGGKLVILTNHTFEIFIKPDRHIQIALLDQERNLMSPEILHVEGFTGDRASPVTLSFNSDQQNHLVSNQPIPDGNNHPTLLKFFTSRTNQIHTARFNADLSTCPDCQLPEYTCICQH